MTQQSVSESVSRSVSLSVVVPYAIEKVWQALTEKELLSEWLMPTDFEPLEGREFRFKGKPNRFWRGYVDCKVLKVSPYSLVQYSWQSVAAQTPTTITHAIERAGEGVKLTATHSGFDKTHGLFSGWLMRAMIRQGMKVEFKKKLPITLQKHFRTQTGLTQ